MASALRKLSDADLQSLHCMIRRDACTDAQIWDWAAPRLPPAEREKSAEAGAMTVQRYRHSAAYREWHERALDADARLERDVRLQSQRFEFLRDLVGPGASADGLDALSRSLQARLLTLAAEASDEELVDGAAKSGWIKNVIRAVQADADLRRKSAAETAAETAADTKLSPEERARRVREIFGK
jgi:hypothetical protein